MFTVCKASMIAKGEDIVQVIWCWLQLFVGHLES